MKARGARVPTGTQITIVFRGFFWEGVMTAQGITVRHWQPNLLAMTVHLVERWQRARRQAKGGG